MSEELDRQCARALGWHTLPGCDALHKGDECIHDQIPNFSTGCRAARLLEDEIERRGLSTVNTYVSALWDECGCVGTDEGPAIWADEWKLIRATPEQKARAFVAVMERKP